MKQQEKATIRSNRQLIGDYYRAELESPSVGVEVRPGQFVHVRCPGIEHRVLRRPFSVCDAGPGRLSIVYKVVGEGTLHLSGLGEGTVLDVLGPLGVGFSVPGPAEPLVVVAGGYGAAATFLLARLCPTPPTVLIGGRSAGDVLLVDAFRDVGAEVRVATDDGSLGHQGFVTDLLETALDAADPFPRVCACGPGPMLKAVSDIVLARGGDAEISLDHVMCCGVGACFACVVKLTSDDEQGWRYVRTCLDGPVFPASQVHWD